MVKINANVYEREDNSDAIFSTWLKYANERDALEEYLRKNLRLWATKDHLSILEMGCGSGAGAERFFKILKENNISFTYTGVDPFQDQLDRWTELGLSGPNITFVCGTAESFTSDKKFDLVLAIHSLYYVENIPKTLEKMHALGEKMLIVHQGEPGLCEVDKAFPLYIQKGPNIVTTFNDIKAKLESVSIPYHFGEIKARVDVRPCRDPKNEEGRNLIKFLLQRSDISDDIIAEVRAFLSSKGDFMEQDQGCFIISGGDNV